MSAISRATETARRFSTPLLGAILGDLEAAGDGLDEHEEVSKAAIRDVMAERNERGDRG